MAAPTPEDADGGSGAPPGSPPGSPRPGSRPCPRRARQLLHMSVLSQSPSPCGRFLAAGNNYGEVAAFGLAAALSAEATEDNKRPLGCFRGEDTPPGEATPPPPGEDTPLLLSPAPPVGPCPHGALLFPKPRPLSGSPAPFL